MEAASSAPPPGHTPEGGVLVGSDGARRRLVVFEDAQCPYCREFDDLSGDLLRREIAAGAVAVEYRMRSFLGVESVRAANALAAALMSCVTRSSPISRRNRAGALRRRISWISAVAPGSPTPTM